MTHLDHEEALLEPVYLPHADDPAIVEMGKKFAQAPAPARAGCSSSGSSTACTPDQKRAVTGARCRVRCSAILTAVFGRSYTQEHRARLGRLRGHTMTLRTTPPFRGDHVGSLLRPPALLEARAGHAEGRVSDEELRAAEDAAIADVVRLQQDAGLSTVTDGEFRRTSWHMDFIYRIQGVRRTEEKLEVHFHNAEGDLDFTSAGLVVDAPVRIDEPIFGADFDYLRVGGARGDDAEADHPVAEHGPLPRRHGGDRSGGLPRRGPVLGRPVGGLRPAGADDRRARLHLPAARRHQPGLPQRPRAARQRRRAGSRRRAPARALHPPDQRRDRGPARRACR